MPKLSDFREKLNITQAELAEKSNVSVRTIQRIESGGQLKGHTLKQIAIALGVKESDLIGESIDENNYQLIKIINISSLPFTIIPLANIVVPLLIMYGKKEVNTITKQIVSVQILWTIISTIVFLLSAFVGKLFPHEFNLVLIVLILVILTNVFIILRNAVEIDKYNQLKIKTRFSLI